MSFEKEISALSLYVQSCSSWIKDCYEEYKKLLREAQFLFDCIQEIHNPEKDPVSTTLYSAAAFFFLWKYNAFDEDATADGFYLRPKTILQFLTPSNLTLAMFLRAENHICSYFLSTDYTCSVPIPLALSSGRFQYLREQITKPSKVMFLPLCRHQTTTSAVEPNKKQKTCPKQEQKQK
jgi:hypothetical protein